MAYASEVVPPHTPFLPVVHPVDVLVRDKQIRSAIGVPAKQTEFLGLRDQPRLIRVRDGLSRLLST